MLVDSKYMLRPEYRSANVRANWTLVLLGVFGVISLVSISFTVNDVDLLMRIDRGAFVSEETVLASDERRAQVDVLRLAAFVATVIAFCMWIHRASRNLSALGAEGQRFSPGWSVGWWFVPLAMLIVPYRVVKEIWLGSYPQSGDRGAGAWRDAPVSPLLGWWWAAWVTGIVMGYVARVIFDDAEAVQGWIRSGWMFLAAESLWLVAGMMLFVLVWQVTSNQEKKCGALSP